MREKLLKGFLIFGGAYLIFDALLHLSNIKLSTVSNWPFSATAYGNLINYIYASFVLLAGGFSFIIQNDLKKYKQLVLFSALWAIFHGIILLFLVWSNNYQQIFQSSPSLLVWLPFYREYLTFNALLLFIYSAVVHFWQKS